MELLNQNNTYTSICTLLLVREYNIFKKLWTILPKKHDHIFGTQPSQHECIDPVKDNLTIEVGHMCG